MKREVDSLQGTKIKTIVRISNEKKIKISQ